MLFRFTWVCFAISSIISCHASDVYCRTWMRSILNLRKSIDMNDSSWRWVDSAAQRCWWRNMCRTWACPRIVWIFWCHPIRNCPNRLSRIRPKRVFASFRINCEMKFEIIFCHRNEERCRRIRFLSFFSPISLIYQEEFACVWHLILKTTSKEMKWPTEFRCLCWFEISYLLSKSSPYDAGIWIGCAVVNGRIGIRFWASFLF